MNLNQRMEALERKIDQLLSLHNVEANPGTSTEQGRTFAPGSGPIEPFAEQTDGPHADCPEPCDGHGNIITADGVLPKACPGPLEVAS